MKNQGNNTVVLVASKEQEPCEYRASQLRNADRQHVEDVARIVFLHRQLLVYGDW